MQNESASQTAINVDGVTILGDYRTRDDGTLQYTQTIRVDVGCCSQEIVREYWDKAEITPEMRQRDINEIRKALNDLQGRHLTGCRLPVRFTIHRPREDRMTAEQKRNNEHLTQLVSSLMYEAEKERNE